MWGGGLPTSATMYISLLPLLPSRRWQQVRRPNRVADISSKRSIKVNQGQTKVFLTQWNIPPLKCLKSAQNKTAANFNIVISFNIQMGKLTGLHRSQLNKKIRNKAWGDVWFEQVSLKVTRTGLFHLPPSSQTFSHCSFYYWLYYNNQSASQNHTLVSWHYFVPDSLPSATQAFGHCARRSSRWRYCRYAAVSGFRKKKRQKTKQNRFS